MTAAVAAHHGMAAHCHDDRREGRAPRRWPRIATMTAAVAAHHGDGRALPR
jgi:hypothetical protein